MANSRNSDVTVGNIDDHLSSTEHRNPSGAKRLSTDPRYRQACKFCRDAKLRCHNTSDDPGAPCRRCANAGRRCVVIQRELKVPKKLKTAEQVEKLQNQVALLTAMINGSQNDWTTQAAGARTGEEDVRMLENARIFDDPFTPVSASKNSTSLASHLDSRNSSSRWAPVDRTLLFLGFNSAALEQGLEPGQKSTRLDIIDRKIVSPSSAAASFNTYVNSMAPILPVVIFPPGTKASDIRRTKPTLFLCILGITSTGEIRQTLKKELRQIFADLITRDGEKSVELVQALFIWAAWYTTEEEVKHSNFYHFLHTAAFMIMDIVAERTGKDMIHVRFEQNKRYLENDDGPSNHETLSIKRAWLGCYLGCSLVSIASGRPSPFPWNPFTSYCVESLEALPETCQLDKKLCLLAQQQLIADDCRQYYSTSNLADKFNLSKKTTQATIRVLEGRVDLWYRDIPIEMASPLLEIHMHILKLYVHQPALRFNDFTTLFNSPLTKSFLEDITFEAEDFTPERINGIFACLGAVHAILKLFCSYSSLDMKNLPSLYFVRILFSVCVLARISRIFSIANFRLGKTFDEGNLGLPQYFGHLVSTLDTASQDGRCPLASSISAATRQVWSICEHHAASIFPIEDIPNIRVTGPFNEPESSKPAYEKQAHETLAASQNDLATARLVQSADCTEAYRPFQSSATIAPDMSHTANSTAFPSTGASRLQNLEQFSTQRRRIAGDETVDCDNWLYFDEEKVLASEQTASAPIPNDFQADPNPTTSMSETFSSSLFDDVLFPTVWENRM